MASTDYYDVVGEGGSEPGNYRFKVTLKPGKWWKDGTNTPIFVTYIIN
nr:MAG TPA: anchoring/assembly protein [Bacteriophage sp.]